MSNGSCTNIQLTNQVSVLTESIIGCEFDCGVKRSSFKFMSEPSDVINVVSSCVGVEVNEEFLAVAKHRTAKRCH